MLGFSYLERGGGSEGEGKDDVAESCKQRIFMVVGESHQNKAIQMAGAESSRLDLRSFLFSRVVSAPRVSPSTRRDDEVLFHLDRDVACSVESFGSATQCQTCHLFLCFGARFGWNMKMGGIWTVTGVYSHLS